MKYLLNLSLLLISLNLFSQGGVRVFFEKPGVFYKQTAIMFTHSTTDQIDICCDAELLGNPPFSIYTEIQNNPYIFNYMGLLETDKIVPLITKSILDTGTFTIGIDQTFGTLIPTYLIDNQNPGNHLLPYTFEGNVENRFSLIFKQPLNVEIINGCGAGYVVINNDIPEFPYYLTNLNGENWVLPPTTDTIYDLSSGEYILYLYNGINQSVSFTIENTVLDASLNIPQTTIYLEDSYIAPVLNIYSPYNSIEWDFGDGTIIYNDINPIHFYSHEGIYNLVVKIEENQCSLIFEAQIEVNGYLNTISNIKYKNLPRYTPIDLYYAIDGKLMKR
jgi:hypothetical protein